MRSGLHIRNACLVALTLVIIHTSPAAGQSPQSVPIHTQKPAAAERIIGATPQLPPLGRPLSEAGRNSSSVPAEPAEPAKGEFFAAPIPIVDPTIGSGLGAVGGYIFQLNKDSTRRPTTVGGGGFGTSNKSWGALGMIQASLLEDTYRITSYGGVVEVNYDYFGAGAEGEDGVSIPLNVQGAGFAVDAMRKIKGAWFAGPRYQYIVMSTAIQSEEPGNGKEPPLVPEDQLSVNTGALGFHLQRDSRDSPFYPRKGMLIDVQGDYFRKTFGGDFSYQRYDVAFNQYISLGEKQVLAYRAKVCGAGGDAPFFALCMLGMPQDLRGYKLGRFQDRALWSTQAEYRLELPYRFGFAAFAGVGEVTPSLSEINANRWLPGGGVGLRWTAAKKNHLNLRVDYAWGKNGSNAFYISVGEAF